MNMLVKRSFKPRKIRSTSYIQSFKYTYKSATDFYDLDRRLTRAMAKAISVKNFPVPSRQIRNKYQLKAIRRNGNKRLIIEDYPEENIDKAGPDESGDGFQRKVLLFNTPNGENEPEHMCTEPIVQPGDGFNQTTNNVTNLSVEDNKIVLDILEMIDEYGENNCAVKEERRTVDDIRTDLLTETEQLGASLDGVKISDCLDKGSEGL